MNDLAIPMGLGADAQSLRLGEALFGRRRQPKSPNEALQPQAAPPPPPPPRRRKRSPILSAASGILSFLVIVAIGAGLLDSSLQRSLRTPGPLAADKIVVIPPGTPPGDIADQLESEGVISNKFMFNFAAVREGVRSSLKAGEYNFKQQASLQDTIDVLVSGKAILHSVTIPEGLTSEQVVNRLKDNDILVGDVREIPKEGSLLPDTYKFARGLSRDQLLQLMAKDQKKLLDEIWKKRAADVPVKSPWELVTLASIVEKETGRADERPHVASVFANRLAKRMRLQSDPTIIYGIVGGKGTLGRGILKKEVETPTPYNTYTIDGLPPGPIANPGRAAMEAVANPSKTRDLFFVADGTGGHVFAETLDQHNKNVSRWREIEKDAKEKYQPADPLLAPAATPAPPPGTKGALEPGDDTAYGTLTGVAAARHETPAVASADPDAVGVAALRSALAGRPGKSATVADRLPAVPPVQAANARTAAAGASFSFGPLVQELAANLPGLSAFAPNAPGDAAASIAQPPASLETYPVSPARVAEQRARAAQYGVLTDAPAPRAEAAPVVALAMAGAAVKTRRGAIDASEGTALDPLRNRDFDLSSAKTIPALK